jgi:hypothetical protein
VDKDGHIHDKANDVMAILACASMLFEQLRNSVSQNRSHYSLSDTQQHHPGQDMLSFVALTHGFRGLSFTTSFASVVLVPHAHGRSTSLFYAGLTGERLKWDLAERGQGEWVLAPDVSARNGLTSFSLRFHQPESGALAWQGRGVSTGRGT